MVQVIEKSIKVPNEVKNSFTHDVLAIKLYTPLKKGYTYLKRRLNPDYDSGIKRLSFESCLITTNGSKFTREKTDLPSKNGKREIHIKTLPKWYTDLLEWDIDQETGEMYPIGVYTSDDFKVSNGKKIKALDKFCKKYQPMYQRKQVSLFFLTFTRANFARMEWAIMVKIIMQYFKRAGLNVRGQLWTSEISDTLHWHYHICISTDRVDFRTTGIPPLLKFDELWGQRTEIDFVKKNVRHYMAKYFAKCNSRVIGQRSYSISRKLK